MPLSDPSTSDPNNSAVTSNDCPLDSAGGGGSDCPSTLPAAAPPSNPPTDPAAAAPPVSVPTEDGSGACPDDDGASACLNGAADPASANDTNAASGAGTDCPDDADDTCPSVDDGIGQAVPIASRPLPEPSASGDSACSVNGDTTGDGAARLCDDGSSVASSGGNGSGTTPDGVYNPPADPGSGRPVTSQPSQPEDNTGSSSAPSSDEPCEDDNQADAANDAAALEGSDDSCDTLDDASNSGGSVDPNAGAAVPVDPNAGAGVNGGQGATPSLTTLWPVPGGSDPAPGDQAPAEPVPTAPMTTHRVAATQSTATVAQSSVTFVKAEPPGGWVPHPTTRPGGEPSEVTLWPGSGPSTAADGNYVGNVANVQSTVYVTIAVPDAGDGTTTVVMTAPPGDVSLTSAVPKIFGAPSYSHQRKRNIKARQNYNSMSMSTQTFWRSDRLTNTTGVPEPVPITGDSATNFAIPLALACACLLLVIAELFF